MKFEATALEGVFAIDLFHAHDDRGTFVKTFHKTSFEAQGLETRFDESFYSTSCKNVIRGMHFQLPPNDHAKIIYVTSGRLIDVVLDLRKGQPTYGQTISVELSGDNFRGIYLPIGVAHGFAVQEDNTNMVYLTSTMHNPASDRGIRWDSFGFDWPVDEPIMSARDKEFPGIDVFDSPF